MPNLTINKEYANDTILTEAQLDDAFASITGFVNTTKIGSDNIQNNAVGSTQIADTAVTTVKLAANAVTDAKLASSASVDADRAVGTNHIKDGAVTGAKIAPNAITVGILPARPTGSSVGVGGLATSPLISVFQTTSTTPVSITNCSITIATTGRPVRIDTVPNSGSSISGIATFRLSGGLQPNHIFTIQRNGTDVCSTLGFLKGNPDTGVIGYPSQLLTSQMVTIDFPPAGTHTYTGLLTHVPDGANTGANSTADSFYFCAYEL